MLSVEIRLEPLLAPSSREGGWRGPTEVPDWPGDEHLSSRTEPLRHLICEVANQDSASDVYGVRILASVRAVQHWVSRWRRGLRVLRKRHASMVLAHRLPQCGCRARLPKHGTVRAMQHWVSRWRRGLRVLRKRNANTMMAHKLPGLPALVLHVQSFL